MAHPYLAYGALGVSCLPGLIGINLLIRPETMVRDIGFPVPTAATDPSGENRKMIRSLTRFMGIRNMALSYVLSQVWASGDERLLGKSMVGLLFMCVTDGFISRAHIGGGAANHWVLAPVVAGLGAGLMGWFD